MTLTVTHEYPGILVISGANGGGDVAIDRDGNDWRAVAYRGPWADEHDSGESVDMATAPLSCSDGHSHGCDECDAYTLADATVGPFRDIVNPEQWYVRVPGGSCFLITVGHVFAYWTDDGGACSHIAHRLPDGGGECDALACDYAQRYGGPR